MRVRIAMNRIALGMAAALLGTSASATPAQPQRNPWLAASHYALPHGDPAQQDMTPVAGPLDVSRTLGADEIDYVHLGPAHFGAFISGPYADGRRVLWSNGVDGVYKVDHERFNVLAHLPAGDTPSPYTEAYADERIAWFERGNEGLFALIRAMRAASVLRDLAGVYTLLDRDHRFYVGHAAGAILAYADAVPGDADSAIAFRGRFDFPQPVSGKLIGINMTYDGWIVAATEQGYVILVSRDLQRSHWVRLPHAEDAGDRPARVGYGWVRNSFAVDADNSIYIASRDHLHKVVWTGERLSLDPADGAWSEPYPNNTGEGTGATPSLMGFGDEDRMVVFTDGDRRMNLTLMWRDQIPEDWAGLPGQPSRRIAASVPVTMGKLNLDAIQSEQSVVVAGYGALVVNNEPRNIPWYLPERAVRVLVSFLGSSPRYQPYGVQKFEWNPQTRRLDVAWTAESVSSPNSVPMVSLGSDRVYLIGARDNRWTLEALEWKTGAVDFHYVIGGQRYNSLFAGTLIDEAGRVIYGTPWGRVRLNPRRAESVRAERASTERASIGR